MKLKRRNSKWEFSIHADPEKGPNRVTFDPAEAERYFKKILKRSLKLEDPIVKVVHLPTKLLWETDDPKELNHFINVLVHKVGLVKNDRRN